MLDPKEKTWFESTFFQLPDVCQRQMGAIVGSLIADAAVSGMDLTSLIEQERNNKQEQSSKAVVESFAEQEKNFQDFVSSSSCPRLFSQDLIRSLNRSVTQKVQQQQQRNVNGKKAEDMYMREQSALSLYRTWSPASVAAIEVLNSIEASKSVDSQDWIQGIETGFEKVLSSNSSTNNSSSGALPMPVDVIDTMTPANFSLFPLCSSIPIVVLYPWARDFDVHTNMKTVFESIARNSSSLPYRVCPELTTSSSSMSALLDRSSDNGDNASIKQQQQQLDEEYETTAKAVQYYLAGSSTLLRYLQSNPDPCKNTLLRLRGSKYGFDMIPEVDEEATGKYGELTFTGIQGQKLQQTSAAFATPPLVGVMHSAWNILRSDFYEVPSPKQFEKVIQRCVYESVKTNRGRNPTHLASFVGACLGAKYGCRNLPVDWMTETDRRSQGALTQVVSRVVPMTQWVWNPPQ